MYCSANCQHYLARATLCYNGCLCPTTEADNIIANNRTIKYKGSTALKQIEDYKRQVLKDLYNQCTIPQQKLFCRIYKSSEEIKSSHLDNAICLCERTIEANLTK